MKIKSIIILGRRWFEKVNGNTYHSVVILLNGEFFSKVNFTYGYGDQYIQTGLQCLIDKKKIDCDIQTTPLWKYCRDNKIKYYYDVVDVTRKKDL